MNDDSLPLLGHSVDRRKFLSDSCFAAAGIAAAAATSPVISFAQEPPPGKRSAKDIERAPSLSRQLARWVAGLRYEDLPPAVIDRAKGVTIQALASVLVGSQLPSGRDAVNLIGEEEAGVRSGATIMVSGASHK